MNRKAEYNKYKMLDRLHTGGGYRTPFTDENIMEILAGSDNPSAEPIITIENELITSQADLQSTNLSSDGPNVPPPPITLSNPLARVVQGAIRGPNDPKASKATRSQVSREKMNAAVAQSLCKNSSLN